MERLSEVQLNREEAIDLAESRRWEALAPAERGLFQLRQNKLCLPFSVFHEGITALLGRSVWTHEFADPDQLWAEYLGKEPAPDMAAILAKLPAGKAIVVVIGEQ